MLKARIHDFRLNGLTQSEIARELKVKVQAVNGRLTKMERETMARGWHHWRPKDIELIKRYYPYHPQTELTTRLPTHTWKAIYLKANRCGIPRFVKFRPTYAEYYT